MAEHHEGFCTKRPVRDRILDKPVSMKDQHNLGHTFKFYLKCGNALRALI